MLPWYSLPEYIFGLICLVAILLRDRWLATAAILLAIDCWSTDWLSDAHHVRQEYAWALKALVDFSVAMALAWSLRLRGFAIATLLGVNVSFHITIGASKAFGSLYTQAIINYHTWWAMEYLAFVICGALAVIGFDDHGGKAVRSHIAHYSRRDRRAVLESDVAHPQDAYSGVAHAETVDAIHTALGRLYRLD